MPAVDWLRLRYCAYRFFFPRVSDYNRQATCTCRLAFIIIALWFNADENILSVISIAIFIFGATINPKKKFSACSVFILETLPLEWRINHLFFLTSYATFVVNNRYSRVSEKLWVASAGIIALSMGNSEWHVRRNSSPRTPATYTYIRQRGKRDNMRHHTSHTSNK